MAINFWRSLPSRGAWIEIAAMRYRGLRPMSLPSRGAWIEIVSRARMEAGTFVAPLTGSVD